MRLWQVKLQIVGVGPCENAGLFRYHLSLSLNVDIQNIYRPILDLRETRSNQRLFVGYGQQDTKKRRMRHGYKRVRFAPSRLRSGNLSQIVEGISGSC